MNSSQVGCINKGKRITRKQKFNNSLPREISLLCQPLVSRGNAINHWEIAWRFCRELALESRLAVEDEEHQKH